MPHPCYLIREFEPATDYPMACAWWAAHHCTAVPAALLPRLGVVAYRQTPGETREDMCALWVYLDNSVGVCFCEHVVTRPQLSLREARRSILTALDFLKHTVSEMHYGVMMLRARPAIARILKPTGFVECETGLTSMITSTCPS